MGDDLRCSGSFGSSVIVPAQRRGRKILWINKDLQSVCVNLFAYWQNFVLRPLSQKKLPEKIEFFTDASETKSVTDKSSPECASTKASYQASVSAFWICTP